MLVCCVFSHMLWNVLASLLLFNDGFVCCCLSSFIASLSVELVFFVGFSLWLMCTVSCCITCWISFLCCICRFWFWFCCWFWYFERFFLAGGFFCVLALWVGFLSFAHLIKLFELFWLVCLVSSDLMFRVLSSGHYCREWYKITLTF